eukprot:TRINITY_DN5743_c0_g1_i1.p1 TRINITY_DN5743_c0_g1~~TRINITY_DN5743_c0_g1_i1.p1  ORF type:complete len:485 (+),score=50.39 TRINITY_DN5743_c0_g1_i1:159-1613(+)
MHSGASLYHNKKRKEHGHGHRHKPSGTLTPCTPTSATLSINGGGNPIRSGGSFCSSVSSVSDMMSETGSRRSAVSGHRQQRGMPVAFRNRSISGELEFSEADEGVKRMFFMYEEKPVDADADDDEDDMESRIVFFHTPLGYINRLFMVGFCEAMDQQVPLYSGDCSDDLSIIRLESAVIATLRYRSSPSSSLPTPVRPKRRRDNLSAGSPISEVLSRSTSPVTDSCSVVSSSMPAMSVCGAEEQNPYGKTWVIAMGCPTSVSDAEMYGNIKRVAFELFFAKTVRRLKLLLLCCSRRGRMLLPDELTQLVFHFTHHWYAELRPTAQEMWSAWLGQLGPGAASSSTTCNRLETVSIWQYQRYLPFRHWSDALLPNDPPAWADAQGKPTSKAAPPPPSATWAGDWTVDMQCQCDDEGWQYSSDFQSPFHAAHKSRHMVRRRRWIRYALSPAIVLSGMTHGPTDPDAVRAVVLAYTTLLAENARAGTC